MYEVISAVNNPHIKVVRSLKDRRTRMSLRKFVVEGVNIVKDIPTNVDFDLFITENRVVESEDIMSRATHVYVVTDKVMNAMSDTKTPSGMLAVADIRDHAFGGSDRVIYLDGITDPGNMGTIIRTAVALGIEDVIAVNSVDVYSSKVVRSTMGGIFNTNVIMMDEDEAIKAIEGYKVYTLDMNGENIFDRSFDIDNSHFVLAVGSEAHGIGTKMKERADRVLSLPMTEKIESLNAAVSLSTALYRIMYL